MKNINESIESNMTNRFFGQSLIKKTKVTFSSNVPCYMFIHRVIGIRSLVCICNMYQIKCDTSFKSNYSLKARAIKNLANVFFVLSATVLG